MSEKKLLDCLTGSEALELMDLGSQHIVLEIDKGATCDMTRDITESMGLKEGLESIQNNIDYFEEREKFVKQKTASLKAIQKKLQSIKLSLDDMV